jgi:uncharacterized protein (TIGR02265 family)
MAEKLVFESSIEGLFIRGLGDRMTGPLKAELKTLGLDLDRKLPPAVTRHVWFAAIDAIVRHVYGELPREEAHRELGRSMMEGIEHTFFGRAMAPAVRLLGPRRLLKRVPTNMKTANNFSIGVMTELGPTSAQLVVDDVGDAPHIFCGSLERMVTWAGGKNVKVSVEAPALPVATYLINWVE